MQSIRFVLVSFDFARAEGNKNLKCIPRNKCNATNPPGSKGFLVRDWCRLRMAHHVTKQHFKLAWHQSCLTPILPRPFSSCAFFFGESLTPHPLGFSESAIKLKLFALSPSSCGLQLTEKLKTGWRQRKENFTWKWTSRFCYHFSIIRGRLPWQTGTNYIAIKFVWEPFEGRVKNLLLSAHVVNSNPRHGYNIKSQG